MSQVYSLSQWVNSISIIQLMQKKPPQNLIYLSFFSYILLGLVDILNLTAVAFDGLLSSLEVLKHLIITYSNFVVSLKDQNRY